MSRSGFSRTSLFSIGLAIVVGILLTIIIYRDRVFNSAFRGGTTSLPEGTKDLPPTSSSPGLTFDFDGSSQRNGVPANWMPTVSTGKLICSVVEENGLRALRLRAERASFFLSNSTQPFDPLKYRNISWSWKAAILPTGGDVRTGFSLFGNRNDQAVQVLVVFENKKVLSYVWDTTAPVGTTAREPSLLATVETTVVTSGLESIGHWQEIRRNLVADYRERFGSDPPRVVSLLVQSNSNHTGSIAEGVIGPISVNQQ